MNRKSPRTERKVAAPNPMRSRRHAHARPWDARAASSTRSRNDPLVKSRSREKAAVTVRRMTEISAPASRADDSPRSGDRGGGADVGGGGGGAADRSRMIVAISRTLDRP